MQANVFLERAAKCKHANLYPDYLGGYGRCGTPFCQVSEVHCQDCGAFITECGCGYMRGMDGWPAARRRQMCKGKEAADGAGE